MAKPNGITWDRHEWVPYVSEIASQLWLSDWTFVITERAPDSCDADAAIECLQGRKYARLFFSEKHLRDSEQDQRHTIVHELIHCHLALAADIANQCIDGDKFPPFRLGMEYAVDGLADAIAPLMPLPSQILDQPVQPEPAKPARKVKRKS